MARPIWHERPVVAPVVYGSGAFLVGIPAYACGYLLMESIRWGIYASLFMSSLFILYLCECHRSARREEE